MEVKIIENFFDKEDLKFVKQYCEDVENHTDRRAKGSWDSKLTIGRGEVNIYGAHATLDSELFDVVSKALIANFDIEPNPQSILFHYWQPESFITWHADGNYKAAATVYLNETWDIDNGGLFLYNDGTGIKGEVPKFNKCIFQSGGVPHCTTATHWKAPVRKSLQVFFI